MTLLRSGRPAGQRRRLRGRGSGPSNPILRGRSAQQWADRWKATVNLYRVPFVSHGKQWRPEQMKLVQRFLPTRYLNQRGVA